MNDFFAGVLRFLLRVLLVAMGLLVFFSLVAAVVVLALVWAARAGWARVTGRPVTPWVMRMDPRSGFQAAYRSSERWSARSGTPGGVPAGTQAAAQAAAADTRRGGVLPGAREVTDVQAREVR